MIKGFFKKLYKHWKRYTNSRDYLLFLCLLSLAMIMSGIGLYYTGFHNADTGQNMRYLEAELDIELLDRASDFELYTSQEAYIIGTKYMTYGLLLTAWGMLQLGANLQCFYQRSKK